MLPCSPSPDAVEREAKRLLDANAEDVAQARAKGLEEAMIDRLTLSAKSVAQMAQGLREVAQLVDPIGEITDLRYRPTGIQVGRMRVPLGVIGIIYEARPNVTADAAALLPEERQCRHPARRLGSHPLQPGHRRLRSRRAACRRPAGSRGAGDRDHRPRRGG